MGELIPRGFGDRATIRFVLALFFLALLSLALHLAYSDLKEGGIYWLNLDKERNLPTWFSGALFFLFGLAAIAVFSVESFINRVELGRLRLPSLWLVVAGVGILASLDEMTVLHENLFWREIRQGTQEIGGLWVYLTQWQILFAPVLLCVLAFFVVFFAGRLRLSRGASKAAFTGIILWCCAIAVESVREGAKFLGGRIYDNSVVVEEGLEMAGAIALLTALLLYLGKITSVLGQESSRPSLESGDRILSRRGLMALAAFAVLASIVVGAAAWVARGQAAADAPLPYLHRKSGSG